MNKGLELIARNACFRVGEIDLIMREGEVFVFVEVRLRQTSRFGGAAVTVNIAKQKRLIRAAQCWLQAQPFRVWPDCRFDVVAIDGGRIQWIPHAFGLGGTL
jgi:putative endonuclease